MILPVAVNYISVLGAAVASFVLGMLWYGVIFCKPWMQLMGLNEKKAKAAKQTGMAKLHVIAFITGVVMSYVLAYVISYSGASGIFEAVSVGFLVWLGFVATIMLGSVLWENKPIKLYVLNASYYLISILLMSVILVLF